MHFNKGVSPGFVLVLTLLSLILSTSLASPVDLSTLDTSTNPWIEDPPKLTRTEFANQLRAYQPPEDPYAIAPSYVINRNEEQLDTDPPAPIPSYTIKREDSNIDTDPNPPQQPQQPAPTGNSTGSGGVYGNPHDWAMICMDKPDHTWYCQRSPREYYCSSNGFLVQRATATMRYAPCEEHCECKNLKPRPVICISNYFGTDTCVTVPQNKPGRRSSGGETVLGEA